MRIGAFASAFLCGCTGFGGGDGGNLCEPLPGFYRVTTEETSGNCGDTESLTEVMSSEVQQSKDQDCTGRRWWNLDECSLNLDLVCDIRDDGGMKLGVLLKIKGSVVWRFRDFASGTVQMELDDYSGESPDVSCRGVSNIFYRRVD